MKKTNRFAAQSRSMVPFIPGDTPVFMYRPIDGKDAFDISPTSAPSCFVLTTRSEELFDHLRVHYDVLWIARSAIKRRRSYSVGLSVESLIHFVAWNPSAFTFARGASDCCCYFPRF